MSSFATVSLSLFSPAISSRTGATIRHGPHHSAQKSTSTVLPLSSTSDLKVASVTSTVLRAMGSPTLGAVLASALSSDYGGDVARVVPVAAPDELGGDRAVRE